MHCRLTILGSSSRGNCAFLETPSTSLLVDAGLSAKQITERLASIGKSPSDLHAILITHEHSDHIQGLQILARKFQIPIYANRLTKAAILETWEAQAEGKISGVGTLPWRTFESGQRFELKDFDVEPFSIPHDASDPVGFSIHYGGRCITFLTDLGHMNHLTLEKARQSHVLVLETNHDPRLLQDDPKRPWAIKQRISGRHGHLSNEASATALGEFMSDRLEHLYLAHLSQECNRPELAEGVICRKLKELGASQVHLAIAHPHQPSVTRQIDPLREPAAKNLSLFRQPPADGRQGIANSVLRNQ